MVMQMNGQEICPAVLRPWGAPRFHKQEGIQSAIPNELTELTAVTRGPLAFCEAVRSSAKLVARFLAHWLSCMAAAWSLTVGTAALAEDTILLPGCRERGRT